jgi:hypothetical protein
MIIMGKKNTEQSVEHAQKPGKRDRNRLPDAAILEELDLDVELEPLAAGLAPMGFLVRPTEDHPTPTAFAGILRAIQQKQDRRRPDKPNVWGVFEAVKDQPASFRFDKETGETSPIADGDMVGVSRSGGLHGMREEKIGYLFVIQYTGERIRLDGGRNPMWEIVTAISKHPYTR